MENCTSLSVVKGTTSRRIQFFIGDSTATTGVGLTGLLYNAASIACYYIRDGDAAATIINLANATVGTWTSGGLKEISSANVPGLYELGIPDACLATGANSCTILLKGATAMRNTQIFIELTATNQQDAVRGGLTALPNANAAASGGLWILGSNNTAAITVGNISAGSIAASGTVTFNAFTVTNNMLVSGNSTVTGTTVRTGAVSFGSTFGITGTTTLANLTLGGNLQVTGTTRFIDDMSIESGFNMGGLVRMDSLTITNATNFSGAFSVAGAMTLNSLTVTNATNLTGAVQFGSTLGVTGAVTLTSTLSTGAVTLSALTVTNNLLVSGNSTVGGTTTHTGAVSLGSTLAVTGAITATNASNNIKGVDVTRWLGTLVSTPTVAGVPNVNAKTWNDLATVALPLIPTTAGRTLDVSATGEAGIDWNNLGTPSATVNLSNTRLALVDLVTTVTNNPNAGNGAYAVTATVTDGTNPLQLAIIRVTSGVQTFSSVTNASGQATFSLNAGTYTVSATLAGYEFVPSTRTVTGNNAGTLYTSPIAMTVVVIPLNPTDPSLCRIYGYIRNLRTAAVMANVEVIATLHPGKVAYAGGFLVGRECRTRSNSVGLFQLDVTQNDQITPTGSEWVISCKEAGIHYKAAFNGTTFDLSTALP